MALDVTRSLDFTECNGVSGGLVCVCVCENSILPFYPFLSLQFSDIKYIHIVVFGGF